MIYRYSLMISSETMDCQYSSHLRVMCWLDEVLNKGGEEQYERETENQRLL